MSEPHYVTISTRLTDAQLTDVDSIARARGQTRAATIRWLIADALGRFLISSRTTNNPDGPSDSTNEASE